MNVRALCVQVNPAKTVEYVISILLGLLGKFILKYVTSILQGLLGKFILKYGTSIFQALLGAYLEPAPFMGHL